MTAPYLLRLMCLCLASFFLLHLAFAATVAAMAGRALRLAEGMAADRAARMLLALRLLPPVAAAILVVGVCAPSYLWLEPEATAEHVGWSCLVAALLGGWVCSAGTVRAARAGVRSSRYLRHCRNVMESDAPVMLERHGETTTINVAQRWLAQVDASVWVAWGTTGAVMGYAWRVRQKWKQERQQKDARIAELEKQIDPGRTSSEVTQEGDPKKGDKA